MVLEVEYQEGLDALLSGKINLDDVLELGKEVLYYVAYAIPFVGVGRQFKKPKSERSTLGTIIFSAYTIPFVIKVAYIGSVVITGEWDPTNHIKNIIENIREKKESKLEGKTIIYEEAIKPLDN